MEIAIKKGLDIPIAGGPLGNIQRLQKPSKVALSLDFFEDIKFRLLVKVGDHVKIGQPLLENKLIANQVFVSPGSGSIIEIRRGLKRRLTYIVIDLDEAEDYFTHPSLNSSNKQQIFDWMLRTGLFAHIRMRPFNMIANPAIAPKSIFVKALESAPFVPSAEMQIQEHESFFQKGLEVLSLISKVHLVHKKDTPSKVLKEATLVEHHFAQGPHPIANSSLHIHLIDPIRAPNDVVWTLDAIGVVTIGKMALKGMYHIERIIGICGNGVVEEKRGFFQSRMGLPISKLIEERVLNEYSRLISGSPITGHKVEQDDFLGFFDTTFCVIPENVNQQPFHFLRFGLDKYSATKTYLSGHFTPPAEGYEFTTNQHGEERSFIDGSIYNKVMPIRIPTMQLVKAILAEDYELAEQLGLLEVDPEDFALPSFICPSKIEMMEIVKHGLQRYSKEMGY